MTIRRHEFDGTPNFRDLGGYQTRDGRTVKWRKVFRSGTLANLTDQDHNRMRELGLSLICDLRTDEETTLHPSALPPGHDIQVSELQISGKLQDEDDVSTPTFSEQPDMGPDEIVERIKRAYRVFVSAYSHQYKRMFELLLAEENYPVLIHCMAGKDRTGLACALTLHTLGVPDETIMQDYTMTNQFMNAAYREDRLAQLIPPDVNYNRETADALFDARPDYIGAAFDVINTEFGSIDRYLERGLGVGQSERARLQDLLLD